MLQIPPPKDLLIRLLKQLLLLLIANIKPPSTQPNLPLLIPNINELPNPPKQPQPPNPLINPLLVLLLLLLLLLLLVTLHPILPLLNRPGLKVFLLEVTILPILLLSIRHRYNLITQTLLLLLLLPQLPTPMVRPHLL